MVCKLLWLIAIASLLLNPFLEARAAADEKSAAILAAVKTATGGARWDALAELDLQGTLAQGGQSGAWRQSNDLRQGRYASYDTLGGVAAGEGYDGRLGWFLDEKSMVSVRESIQAEREVATDAYIVRQGWLHATSFDPASIRFVAVREAAGHAYDVIHIVPQGGSGFELWVDAHRHLIDHIVKQTDDGGTETTWYGDYQPVAGVLLPYLQRIGNGDAQYDTTIHLQQVTASDQAQDDHFQRPASSMHDAHIDQDAPFATVPFTPYGGLIMVDVSINGEKPLPFLLDTGGLNLLTPAAAHKLGIDGAGHLAVQGVGEATQSMQVAQVKSYRLGRVELDEQRFLIVALPPLLTDRGEREPIAGLIGYELLRRFVTRIDYDHHTLGFTAIQAFQAVPEQASLPLVFNERTPQLKAKVDGVPGVFSLDSGDSGGLTVFEPFAKAHGIGKRGPVIASQARGAGGKIGLSEAYVDSLALGPFVISHPLTSFAAPAKGVFASSVLAGNIGYDVLSRFVLTFDYEHRRLYLEQGQRFASSPRHGYSGMGLDRMSHEALVVSSLVPGSPAAAAGLRTGDQVTALNGEPASRIDLDQLRRIAEQPAGSRLVLSVIRGHATRTYTLVLRESP
ncbi:aspartyl protease family protein [Dyella choica]|nr:aspartyl protease family protein [Dyella choica]